MTEFCIVFIFICGSRLEEVSVVKDLFFMNTKAALVCRCGMESLKDEQTKITILSYPPSPPPGTACPSSVGYCRCRN